MNDTRRLAAVLERKAPEGWLHHVQSTGSVLSWSPEYHERNQQERERYTLKGRRFEEVGA